MKALYNFWLYHLCDVYFEELKSGKMRKQRLCLAKCCILSGKLIKRGEGGRAGGKQSRGLED